MMNTKTLVALGLLACFAIWQVEGRSFFEREGEERNAESEELADNGFWPLSHDIFPKQGEMTNGLFQLLPQQQLEMALKPNFQGLRKSLSKRNPRCLINCAKLNQIHPIQCHSLC